MPWPNLLKTAPTADTTVATTTETIVATLNGVNAKASDTTVNLRGWVQLTPGTAATTATLRIRRGTAISSPLVGEANAVAVTAAATLSTTIDAQDQPGDVASQSYVLTVQQAAATGNGTVIAAALEADVI